MSEKVIAYRDRQKPRRPWWKRPRLPKPTGMTIDMRRPRWGYATASTEIDDNGDGTLTIWVPTRPEPGDFITWQSGEVTVTVIIRRVRPAGSVWDMSFIAFTVIDVIA